jgi:porin
MKYSKAGIPTIVAAITIIAVAVAGKMLLDVGQPQTARASEPAAKSRFQSFDQDLRYTPTTRPGQPEAQHPPEATTQNTDTGKPPAQWQRLTDDWGGLRTKLEEHGITIDGSFAGYFGKNLTGGASTGKNGGAYLLNVNATLDSKKIAGFDGGTLFVNFRNQNGLHHSLDGAFGSTSHLYSPARTELSEAWYEQKLLDDKIRVRLGKIDANTEFANVANGGEFLNDFGGFSPTILSFPTDPDPAFGVDAFFYPTQHLYAGVGAYDGSLAEGRLTGLLGPAKALHPHSEFLIAETGATWTAPGGRDGRAGVGVWHHTADLARFDGGTDRGATGPYLTVDQTLWRKNPDQDDDKRGIAMFALAGYANPEISAANFQIGGGVKWTGMIESRADDVMGIGADYIKLSSVAGSGFDRFDEVTVETYYKMRLTAWLSVQPDLQFIHNPGGISSQHDAVALTVQALIDF